jgi:hypothetical protein
MRIFFKLIQIFDITFVFYDYDCGLQTRKFRMSLVTVPSECHSFASIAGH